MVLDLPEPWRVVPHAAQVLRLGGIYLSFVPTVPQVMQTVDALRESRAFSLIETFESFSRNWNIQGRSVRPDLRMIAHSGFITVARRVEQVIDAPKESGKFNSPHIEGDIDVIFGEDSIDKVTLSVRKISEKILYVFEGTPGSGVETVTTEIP